MKRFVVGLIVATAALMPAAIGLAQTAYPVGTVNLRGGPGLQYDVVGTLGEGEKAAVLSHTSSWLNVRTKAGLVGFMAEESLLQRNDFRKGAAAGIARALGQFFT